MSARDAQVRNILNASSAALASLAASCATSRQESAPLSASPAAEEALSSEDADPFILMISAERYGYLIELAGRGAAMAPRADVAADETELQRATWATLEAAQQVYALRAQVCAVGLVSPEQCGPLPPPDWFGAPVDAVADVAEINRRIEWLEGAMGPFVDAGCEAGETYAKQPDGPHFCSVE